MYSFFRSRREKFILMALITSIVVILFFSTRSIEALPQHLSIPIFLILFILSFPMLLLMAAEFLRTYPDFPDFGLILLVGFLLLLVYHYLIAYLLLYVYRQFRKLVGISRELVESIKNPICLLSLLSGVSIYLLFNHHDVGFGPLVILNILLLTPVSYLMVYVHELGHVIAAKTVGIDVRNVRIGNGRQLLRKKIFGFDFIITDNFLEWGYTFADFAERKRIKPKYFIVSSGGILMQLLLTMICLHLYGFEPKNFSAGINLPGVFVMANLFGILFSTIPMNFKFHGMDIPNDGLKMIKTPSLSEKEVEELLSVGCMLDGQELYERKEYELAAEAFKKCVTLYPEQEVPKINLSASLMKLLKIKDAEDLLRNLAENPCEGKYSFMVYGNLAGVLLMKNDEKSLREADKYSKKAFDLNPKHPYIRNTRGAILIETGRVDEGIKMLKGNISLKKPVNEKTHNAIGFMFLAYGYFLKDKKDESRKYLTQLSKYADKLDESEKYLLDSLKKKTNNFRKST